MRVSSADPGWRIDRTQVAIELCSDSHSPNELRAKLEHLRATGATYAVMIDRYHGEIWTDGTPPAAFNHLDFIALLN